MRSTQSPLFKSHERIMLPDYAEEEKLPVLTAQGVTLEDYDTTDDEYDYEHDGGHTDGYEDC